MEEKKRGKRLFGGLMNTLSQTTTNSQQRRRQEIERRQQEKATQQRAADTKHREVKLGKIREVRQREQIKFEEQVVSLYFHPLSLCELVTDPRVIDENPAFPFGRDSPLSPNGN